MSSPQNRQTNPKWVRHSTGAGFSKPRKDQRRHPQLLVSGIRRRQSRKKEGTITGLLAALWIPDFARCTSRETRGRLSLGSNGTHPMLDSGTSNGFNQSTDSCGLVVPFMSTVGLHISLDLIYVQDSGKTKNQYSPGKQCQILLCRNTPMCDIPDLHKRKHLT